jgi:hypothetical protein
MENLTPRTGTERLAHRITAVLDFRRTVDSCGFRHRKTMNAMSQSIGHHLMDMRQMKDW